jgi:hypothetical protein
MPPNLSYQEYGLARILHMQDTAHEVLFGSGALGRVESATIHHISLGYSPGICAGGSFSLL